MKPWELTREERYAPPYHLLHEREKRAQRKLLEWQFTPCITHDRHTIHVLCPVCADELREALK